MISLSLFHVNIAKMEAKPFGVVQVPLSNILYKMMTTEVVFGVQNSGQRNLGSKSLIPEPGESRLTVFIDNLDIHAVLSKLRLSRLQLEAANAENRCPFLNDQQVWFVGSRDVLIEAHNMNPHVCLNVELYSADLTEGLLSEGQIYIRHRAGLVGFQWKLSQAQRIGLRVLDWQPGVKAALDRLAAFPGIADDLQLSDGATAFKPHLTEQVVAHLNHIHAVWSYITGGVRVLQQSVDVATVRALEGRAPATSASDLAMVRTAFSTDKAFHRVTDPLQRTMMMRRTCDLLIMIPSLRSFHAVSSHICLIDLIIRTHIVPDECRPASDRKRSLRSKLRKSWSPVTPYVEVREGAFHRILGRASFGRAYKQLVLAALRQFPSLTPPADPTCVYDFQRRAHILGFRNTYIERAVVSPRVSYLSQCDRSIRNSLSDSALLEPVNQRWGCPGHSLLRSIQSSAFLPQMTHSALIAKGVTIPFVLDDFFDRFDRCVFDASETDPLLTAHLFVNPAPAPSETAASAGVAHLEN